MDFDFTKDQKRFRDDLRTFLEEEVPLERQEVFRLGYRGAVPVRPRRGPQAGGSRLARYRVAERVRREWSWSYRAGHPEGRAGYRRVPRTGVTGLDFAGQALLHFGSEEQKREYLPPIARGEVEYCQGFSEPNAGSDLAALELRAVRDGDDYVLNGTKIFTSRAFRSDFIYLLARTDSEAPKHRGLSLFIGSMRTPGISVSPLPYISGELAAQTFFDDVRLDGSTLIGEENQGWYHAMTTLDYERSGLERYAGVRRTFDDFVEFCQTTRVDGTTPWEKPVVRYKLADLRTGMEVWRLLCWKVAWMQSAGAVPNAEASIAFLHGTEERLRFAQTAMQILGPFSTLRHESKWAPLLGAVEGIHRESMHLHGAGTTEIHKNIIAQRGLGLPR